VKMLSENEIKNVCGRIDTSADGLLGIIQSRQIWSTNALYLSDASELLHATTILADELEATPLRLRQNAGTFSMSIPVYSKDLALDHFSSSFCEDKDLLSQWRGYAIGAGYAVGFSSSTLCAMASKPENNERGACALRKVHYSETHGVRSRKGMAAGANPLEATRPDRRLASSVPCYSRQVSTLSADGLAFA
jgi:hypothetical protein